MLYVVIKIDPFVLLGVFESISLYPLSDDLALVLYQTDIGIKRHIQLLGVNQLLHTPILVALLSSNRGKKLFDPRSIRMARVESSL